MSTTLTDEVESEIEVAVNQIQTTGNTLAEIYKNTHHPIVTATLSAVATKQGESGSVESIARSSATVKVIGVGDKLSSNSRQIAEKSINQSGGEPSINTYSTVISQFV